MTGDRHKRSLPPPLGLTAPWLILSHGRHKQLQSFYNASDGSRHTRSIPELRGKKMCCGSFYGWTLMLDRHSRECSLLNLTSMETIRLPPLEPHHDISSAVLSSPPTHPNCVVLVAGDETDFFLFCHPKDINWTTRRLGSQESPIGGSVVSCRGRLFCFMDGKNILAIDVTSPSLQGEVLGRLDFEKLPNTCSMNITLVESCGDLFLVVMYHIGATSMIGNVEVHKMDFAKMAWKKVKSIEDRAFFLAENFASSCSAGAAGVRGNCIYFAEPWYDGVRLFVFCLDDSSFSFDFPCPNVRETWEPPSWAMPV